MFVIPISCIPARISIILEWLTISSRSGVILVMLHVGAIVSFVMILSKPILANKRSRGTNGRMTGGVCCSPCGAGPRCLTYLDDPAPNE